MIYIIQGEEEYFIREKIKELTKETAGEIVRFQGSDKSFDIVSMLDACSYNSLFGDRTTVLVEDPYFLIRKIDDKEYEMLEKYVRNPLYDTDLILYTLQNGFGKRLKAYKMVSENAQIIELNHYDTKNFISYARTRLNEENIKLNSEAENVLISLCRNDATLFNSNLEILKLYPEQITSQAVARLCTSASMDDSFELINALTSRDITKAVSIERKMLAENDSILGLIALLSGQLRYLYHVAYLSSSGKRKHEIQEITGSKEYRVTMALKTLEKLNKRQIMELLARLSDLDCKCKSDSSVSGISRFELFMINLMNRGEHAVY
ncbi:MAG: DNA polymerase III subunit delta [Erysipelotrichaceae bacterium]|nr:DNA polymerase III subunit delta [Erysipelotrichaceae bacterium]